MSAVTARSRRRAVASVAVGGAGFAVGAVMMAAGLLAGSPHAFSDRLTLTDREDSTRSAPGAAGTGAVTLTADPEQGSSRSRGLPPQVRSTGS